MKCERKSVSKFANDEIRKKERKKNRITARKPRRQNKPTNN